MNPPFFITGLPRSRTAWLANLFTTGESLCFHEPAATVTELIARHPSVRVGVADSTAVFNFAAIADVYPEAPWLFVERDPAEARRSLMKFASAQRRLLGREIDAVFNAHQAAASWVKASRATLVVPFAELDQRIEEVWAHLLPRVLFNRERFEILRGLKVEQRLGPALERHRWQR